MFVFLAKKIAIPNGVKLRVVSWNQGQGWIACGGDDKLLKILKLENQTEDEAAKGGKGSGQALSMNDAIVGHQGNVLCAVWNEDYRKLASSDEYGFIYVWVMHKGVWQEEMRNTRNQSYVRDMRWSPNGTKICISYEDGKVVMGSVEGQKIWDKDLKNHLSHCCWDPTGRNIVFATLSGEVHFFDASGSFISQVHNYCIPDGGARMLVSGVEWFANPEGAMDPDAPTLAIAFDNGRIQIMRHEGDDRPVLIDTGMTSLKIRWNPDGSVLAVSGSRPPGSEQAGKEFSMVQFYTPFGDHLRTLKVPGNAIASLSWEGSGLRLALAVDSFIYFANVRPDYLWAYFHNVLVYAFPRPEKREHCIVFWDTESNERQVKYLKKLHFVRGAGENCVLVTYGLSIDDENRGMGQAKPVTTLILCNSIGSPVETKQVDIKPVFVQMTASHIIVASDELIYVWQYRSSLGKVQLNNAIGGGIGGSSSSSSRDQREQMFHVDDTGYTTLNAPDRYEVPRTRDVTDRIASIAASDRLLVIGRESGALLRFTLPSICIDAKNLLRCRPQQMAVNCNSTMLSIIDINGILSFFDLDARPENAAGGSGGHPGEHLSFERKDAWDMCWSEDNPELFAMMEKTRMYVFRGMHPEEPVTTNGYICGFNDLKITVAQLDDIFQKPDEPSKQLISEFETKSLRDIKVLLETVGLNDAYSFVAQHPHNKLWKILAEAALEKLDFAIADKAFVRYSDYQGIRFVQRLKLIDDKRKQRAEVAAYFKRFEEAEQIYLEMDRKDLAIELRARTGGWVRVLQMLKSGGVAGDDELRVRAWNEIGEYYADHMKWTKALEYFSLSKNTGRLIECYYVLEDFVSLDRLIATIPEGSPLLLDIGDKFRSVGMSKEATSAFVRAGEPKLAVDTCVELNQWDTAVNLAERFQLPQIQGLLSKYATYLLEKNRHLEAVELYRKARYHVDAAFLLMGMAKDSMRTRGDALLAKKLYVLAALNVEQGRRNPVADISNIKNAVSAIEGMLSDTETGKKNFQGNPWRGAEAFHFMLLCQRSLYRTDPGSLIGALAAAYRLQDYEDVIPEVDIYCLLALAAYMTSNFDTCSKAFMKLESMVSISDSRRLGFQELALDIFSLHPPVDTPLANDAKQCPKCSSPVAIFRSACVCGEMFRPCVMTGLPIVNKAKTPVLDCKQCKHSFFEVAVRRQRNCPLCHYPLDVLDPSMR